MSSSIILALQDQADSGFVFLIFFLLSTLGFFALAYYYNPKRRLRKSMADSPAIAYYNAKQGQYVRLQGNAVLKEDLLEAPLSGRKCICYYVEIKGPNSDGRIVRIHSNFQYNSFYIESEGDRALVNPKTKGVINHDIFLDRKSIRFPHTFPIDRLKNYLIENKIEDRKSFVTGKSPLQYFEGVILEHEKISVKGTVNWFKDESTQKRSLELTGTYDVPVLISNDPKVLRILPKKLR